MSWYFSIFSAEIDGVRINVQNREGELTVRLQDRPVTTLEELLNAVPALRHRKHLTDYCRLANYLLTDTMFRVIADVEVYRREYALLYDGHGDPATVSRNYGPFDLAGLSEPCLEDGVPVFYAESAASLIPYRVSIPYPQADREPEADYQPLPYLEPDEAEPDGAQPVAEGHTR